VPAKDRPYGRNTILVAAAVARKVVLFLVAGFSLFLLDRLARTPRPRDTDDSESRGDVDRAAKRVAAGGSLGVATFLVAWFGMRYVTGSPVMAYSAIPYVGILQTAAFGFAVGSLLSLLSTRWNK
jgi:hypothetical protein